jgi:regulator of protease activity HflC (stomatin/prohibitin superfamily)
MAAIGFILAGIAIAIIVLFLVSGLRVVQPYEQGLYIFLGKYRGKLNTGLNFVIPFGSRVIRLDMRTQVMDVPRQEVITKDNSPTNVDAIIYVRVVDPERSYFEVSNHKIATVALAQTTLRSVIGDMDLDDVLNQREKINGRLQDILDKSTDAWGVRVEGVEIREVDPVERVKRAMEEQTSAERERRAAILRADGQRQAAILEAEGQKRALILRAEGDRQSAILASDGDRKAQILISQGKAQALHVLSMGASTLDQKALAVLGFDALEKLANGQATKIIIPFELTSLMRGGAQALGAAAEVGAYTANDLATLEKILGPVSKLIGEAPDAKKLALELDKLAAETGKGAQMEAESQSRKAARAAES